MHVWSGRNGREDWGSTDSGISSLTTRTSKVVIVTGKSVPGVKLELKHTTHSVSPNTV
jgi:hypothetical protein